jgi:cytochrome d ubiquinol oxidase subunit I
MVGCGLLMLAIAWLGSFLLLTGRTYGQRLLLRATFLSFPLPFVATLTGWFTAEVGRQPWSVYGVLKTADAVTPHLTVSATLTSLIFFGIIYVVIFSFGTLFIYRMLRTGPSAGAPPLTTNAKRPLALAGDSPEAETVAMEGGR